MPNRTHTADVLKGIAILLMIQVHLVELFASHELATSRVGKVFMFLGGPPVAPLFMILFGYFISVTHKSTQQLIVRGVKIFALGMLLNLALNFNLIYTVWRGLLQIDILPFVFGVDILQFAGLSLIVIGLLKKVLEQQLTMTVMVIVASVLLGQYLAAYIPENNSLKYVTAFFYGSAQWSYFPLFPWLAYPLTGMVLYQLQQRYQIDITLITKTNRTLAIGALLFVILTIGYAISIASDLPSYYHHGILFFLWMIVFLSLYSTCVHAITERIGTTMLFTYLTWLGKHVTLIYIIQWIIIGNMATEIYKSITSPLYLASCFVGVLGASSGICYIALWLKELLNRKTTSS
jgi:uncharacterized membrane protein